MIFLFYDNKFKTFYDYYIIVIKGFFTVYRKGVLFMGVEHSGMSTLNCTKIMWAVT